MHGAWALVLMQQGNGINERQILLVIPPVARAPRREGQIGRVGIEDFDRLQKRSSDVSTTSVFLRPATRYSRLSILRK
ncbi:MAG: hypothetical protein EXS36_15390 [Pedosphaera sp.]|nr:hypothetical protein [Pedosphaera sp.]